MKIYIIAAVLFLVLFLFSQVKAQGTQQVIGSASLYIFGVTNSSNGTLVGVPALLNLTITNGTGKVFLGSTPLTQTDTQAQGVLSAELACQLLNVNCDDYNFYYYITSSSVEVGGPSAGSAFTMAAMSILSGKPLNPKVAMTGTANPDGSVGIVGDVSQKSMAAANQGIKTFLYPATDNISTAALSYDEAHGETPIAVNSEYQAFQYFTGYNVTPAINLTIQTPLYINLMKQTYIQFNVYQEGLQSGVVNTTNSTIQQLISEAYSDISSQKSEVASGNYYIAASSMITSSSDLLQARLLEEIPSTNQVSFVKGLINKENSTIAGIASNISNDYVSNSSTLILKFIAFDRLMQAQDYLNDSVASLSSGNIQNAIYYYSLAAVKAQTAYFWVSILPLGKSNFSQSNYETLSNYYLYKASSYLDYANLLGAQLPSEYSQAESYLASAQSRYYSGNYISSIFASIESISVSQMLIEENSLVSNSALSEIGNQSSIATLNTINSAEKAGVTPFLGISYYYFGNQFYDPSNVSNSDFLEYLLFETEARAFTMLGTQLSNASLIPYTPSLQPIQISKPVEPLLEEIGFIILGIAIGVVLSGIIFEYKMYRRVKKLNGKSSAGNGKRNDRGKAVVSRRQNKNRKRSK
ncbi:MAG: S16 family serine protease [Candidatus Parvarchaeum sp.]